MNCFPDSVCICAWADTGTCLFSTEREREEGRSMKVKCGLQNIFQNCYSWISLSTYMGFLDGSVVKNPLAMWEMCVWSLEGIREIPWRRKWQPTPVFLPEKSHGQRTLAGYSPRVAKSWLWLSPTQAHAWTWTHSRVLGWPKNSFMFFYSILWKNLNKPFGQPCIFACIIRMRPDAVNRKD